MVCIPTQGHAHARPASCNARTHEAAATTCVAAAQGHPHARRFLVLHFTGDPRAKSPGRAGKEGEGRPRHEAVACVECGGWRVRAVWSEREMWSVECGEWSRFLHVTDPAERRA